MDALVESMMDAGSDTSTFAVAEPVLLASRSPRRSSLLAEAGIEHRAEHPGFDDADLRPGNVSPPQWVSALAYLKAWAKHEETGKARALIIGADTACVLDGELIGTPASEGEARTMLRRFVGRSHDVVTGVAIIEADNGRRHLFSDTARVEFGALSPDEIERYAATGLWAGKAGAYNLSERLEAGWPIIYEGDPSTIMGLPMRSLKRVLGSIARRRELEC